VSVAASFTVMRVQVQVARNEWSPTFAPTPGFVEDFWLGFDLLSSTNREVTARDGWGRDGCSQPVVDNG